MSEPARQETPFSVMCGMDSICFAFKKELSARGFRIQQSARVKLLLDIPRAYAMHTLQQMDRKFSKVIVVTWNSCPEHMEDLRELNPDALIADEFLTRSDLDETLHRVLKLVSRGEQYFFTPGPRTSLTVAEREVLSYVARGWSNRQIGEQLYISEQTVKNRLRSVYRKLNLRNHTQASLYYWQVWQPVDSNFSGCRLG